MYTKTHTSKKDAAKEMGGRLITAHLERREIPPSECVTGVLTSRDVRTLVTLADGAKSRRQRGRARPLWYAVDGGIPGGHTGPHVT